jgi:putative mRNA 3-end processing factor
MTDTLNPRSWLYPTPRGLYCEPATFYVDPAVAVTRAVITHGHGDHARPGHRSALATPETLAIMRARFQDMPDTSQQPLKYGESVKIGDVEVSLVPPAISWLGAGRARYKGQRIVVSGDYKRRPDADLPAVRAGPVRRLHHRGDLRPAGVPPSLRLGRDRQAAALARDLSRAHPSGGVYALGKCQRVIKLLRAAGYDKRIWIHGALASLCKLYQDHGVELGDIALVSDAILETFKGAIVLCPPSAIADRWSRRFLRSDPVDGVRLDGRARPRPPARRRAAADHLRSCRLGRADPDSQGCRRPKVWVTHGREEALVAYARSIGIDAEALHLAGREEEDET